LRMDCSFDGMRPDVSGSSAPSGSGSSFNSTSSSIGRGFF